MPKFTLYRAQKRVAIWERLTICLKINVFDFLFTNNEEINFQQMFVLAFILKYGLVLTPFFLAPLLNF